MAHLIYLSIYLSAMSFAKWEGRARGMERGRERSGLERSHDKPREVDSISERGCGIVVEICRLTSNKANSASFPLLSRPLATPGNQIGLESGKRPRDEWKEAESTSFHSKSQISNF